MSLTATHKWSEQSNLFVVEFLKDVLNDFFFAELDHLFSCVVAIGFPDTCEQETKKIVYFGNCTNC